MQQIDDEIKALFKGLSPKLTSDSVFMARLQKNMEAVEAVKSHVAALQRRNRIAVVAASLAGFVMGVVCTLLFPVISDSLGAISFSIPRLQMPAITVDWRIVGWLLTGVLSVLAAVQTYGFTLSRISVRAPRLSR